MSKQAIGTTMITGLNTGRAPHLIEDHELTVSMNGWTDKEGTWSTADGPDVLYTGYSAISCFASGRMGGADHAVWMDGNTLYDNGTSVGTITAGDTMTIKSVGDGFLILGATKSYLYDGDHVRELGTWQYNTVSLTGVSKTTPASDTIVSISKAANAVMVTTNSIFAAANEYVYISGAAGMTAINGLHKVVSVSGTGPFSYTLEVDSSAFATYTGSGTAYGGACGLTGDYKYYLVPTITISDGTLMLGRPRGMSYNGYAKSYTETGSWDADSITLAPAESIKIRASIWWNDGVGGDPLFVISGTKGTDYTPGLRLYRTKADGSDFYLEKEWSHGDSDFSEAADKYSITQYSESTLDKDLGAVYTADFGDHNNPPAATEISTVVSQRLYLADADKVYWSHLDGIEFWNDLDYVKMPDTITALASVRDKVVMFSSDRIWAMDMSTGFPDIREIDTPVGTTFAKPMVTVDMGLLFLREDGLWLFDGVTVKCISRRAFTSISAPASICATGDTIYMSGDAYSYVVRVRDGGWVWHAGDATYALADATGGHIYAASPTTIANLFEGGPAGGMFTTKLFGGFDETKTYRVILDVEGPSRPQVSINGVRQGDIAPHGEAFPVVTQGRRIVRYPVPRLANPFFTMTVSSSGDLKVHGFKIEVC